MQNVCVCVAGDGQKTHWRHPQLAEFLPFSVRLPLANSGQDGMLSNPWEPSSGTAKHYHPPHPIPQHTHTHCGKFVHFRTLLQFHCSPTNPTNLSFPEETGCPPAHLTEKREALHRQCEMCHKRRWHSFKSPADLTSYSEAQLVRPESKALGAQKLRERFLLATFKGRESLAPPQAAF